MSKANKIILIKLGELWLKGKNRDDFINRLVLNIQSATGLSKKDVQIGHGRIYLSVPVTSYQLLVTQLKYVFGIHSFAEAYKTELDTSASSVQVLEKTKKVAVEVTQKEVNEGAKSFKINTTRANKKFSAGGGSAPGGEKNSMEINKEIGAAVLDIFNKKLSVDVKNPDFVLNIEVREGGIFIYSSSDEVKGAGGLPVGTGGRGLAMLSGGIDSPVSMWHMMKRGMKVDAVHFYSPPYTGEKAKQKVIDLCRQLALWNGGEIKLFLINFSKLQIETKKAPQNFWTLLHRRLMIKLAYTIAIENNYDTLVSGESLSQVASQTIQNIRAVSYGINFPILRPLVGFDKQEIIDIAEQIDTYRISILPYEDCCVIFAPRNPKIRAKEDEVAKLEEKLDRQKLIQEAVENMKTIKLT